MSRGLPPTRSRIGLRFAAALALALVLLVPAAPARASGAACWKRLVNDWQDGRIDRSYSVRCYQQALAGADQDLLDYSSLPSDLGRALLAAARGVVPAGQVGAQGAPRYDRGVREQRSLPAAARGKRPAPAGTPRRGHWQALAALAATPPQLPLPLFGLLGAALLLLAGGAGSALRRRHRCGGRPKRAVVTAPVASGQRKWRCSGGAAMMSGDLPIVPVPSGRCPPSRLPDRELRS